MAVEFGTSLGNLGFGLPTNRRDEQAANIFAIAEHAERVGLGAVWLGDHIALPRNPSMAYPYGDGKYTLPSESLLLDPLATAGKLGALLAQFPPSFKNDPASRDYLSWLLQAFADYRVAVELRHSSWSDAVGDTLGLLNPFAAAWVQIDEPKFRFSIKQNFLPNVQGIYYMRLHGRNARQWWSHEKAEDRYNYLYSAPEISEFVDTLDAARDIVEKAYLYTNNHFSAKSVANAATIKKQLGEPLTGEYSAEFLSRYPEVTDALKPAEKI